MPVSTEVFVQFHCSVWVCSRETDKRALSPAPTLYQAAQLQPSTGFCPTRWGDGAPLIGAQTPDLAVKARIEPFSLALNEVSPTSSAFQNMTQCCRQSLFVSQSPYRLLFFHCILFPGGIHLGWTLGVLNGRRTGNLMSLKFRRERRGGQSVLDITHGVQATVPGGCWKSQVWGRI